MPSNNFSCDRDKIMSQATLNGYLENDGGLSCEVSFEWGASIDYGMTTPWQSVVIFSYFSAIISNLGASHSYHFRAVARNALGISYGQDSTFTTLGEVGMITFVDDGDLIRIIG